MRYRIAAALVLGYVVYTVARALRYPKEPSVSYFVDKTKVHRISMEPFDGSDDWFEIKDELTRAERLTLDEIFVRYEAQGGVAIPSVQFRRQFEALLKSTIVGWSFLGPDDVPAPVNEAAFRALGQAVGKFMADEIDAYYARSRRTDDDLKNSASEPSPGSWETDPSPPSLLTSSSPNGLVSTRKR